jgi:hypothetical protein
MKREFHPTADRAQATLGQALIRLVADRSSARHDRFGWLQVRALGTASPRQPRVNS